VAREGTTAALQWDTGHRKPATEFLAPIDGVESGTVPFGGLLPGLGIGF
jgi:hypothetical protein